MPSTEMHRRATTRFSLFFAASLAGHGALTLWIVPPRPPVTVSETPLQITFRAVSDSPQPGRLNASTPAPEAMPAAAVALAKAQTSPLPKRSNATPRAQQTAPAGSAPSQPRAQQAAAAPAHRATPPDTRPAELDSAVATQRAGLALRTALARHFSYPPRARRHGWAGEVTLGVRIQSDGHLTGARILRTSGHRVLDRAALHSLKKVESLPNAAAWLNGNHLDMVVPVHYRLIDG